MDDGKIRVKFNNSDIEAVKGDITIQDTEAIVNAANRTLLGGGGVDGAIHRAAGDELVKACSKIGGCGTGDAKVTPGYGLKAGYVIHAVGPVYSGKEEDARLLSSCYRRSFELAKQHGIRSISFPAISTGVYRYPKKEAAEIALNTVKESLEKDDTVKLVRFVLFDEESFNIYKDLMENK